MSYWVKDFKGLIADIVQVRPLKSQDTGAPGEAAAHRLEQQHLARLDPSVLHTLVQGERTDSNDLYQLAVNKAGTIRGNYYSVLSNTTVPVYGAVDKTTQLAAWTVGDQKEPIYEAGFANLTKGETTMMVHFGKNKSQQWNLIRIEQPTETQ